MATRTKRGVPRPSNQKLGTKQPVSGGITPRNVRSAQKTEEKVWNITDHPDKPGGPKIVMIMGRNVQPGHAVRVPVERLKNATRLKKMEAEGRISIGPKPPTDYLIAKGRKRAVVNPANTRTHGYPKEKRALLDARKARGAAKVELKRAATIADDAAKKASAKDASDVMKNRSASADKTAERAKARLAEAESTEARAREAFTSVARGSAPAPTKKVVLEDKVVVTDEVTVTSEEVGEMPPGVIEPPSEDSSEKSPKSSGGRGRGSRVKR